MELSATKAKMFLIKITKIPYQICFNFTTFGPLKTHWKVTVTGNLNVEFATILTFIHENPSNTMISPFFFWD